MTSPPNFICQCGHSYQRHRDEKEDCQVGMVFPDGSLDNAYFPPCPCDRFILDDELSSL